MLPSVAKVGGNNKGKDSTKRGVTNSTQDSKFDHLLSYSADISISVKKITINMEKESPYAVDEAIYCASFTPWIECG